LVQIFIVHQFSASQSEMQRLDSCAQAPDALAFSCFAASAGDNDTTPSAPASTMVAIDREGIEPTPNLFKGQVFPTIERPIIDADGQAQAIRVIPGRAKREPEIHTHRSPSECYDAGPNPVMLVIMDSGLAADAALRNDVELSCRFPIRRSCW
jgi:hypothetical protein